MTPRDVAIIVAKQKRMWRFPAEIEQRQLFGALYLGLIRWDTETEGERPAYVLTDKGRAIVGDAAEPKRRRKA